MDFKLTVAKRLGSNCCLSVIAILRQLSVGLHCSAMICSLMQRLAFAFGGLLVGDGLLLLCLLAKALRRATLSAAHFGEPTGIISVTFQTFDIYAIFSFVGWLVVGLPIALFFPARFITRLSWPLRVLVGAALGPVALFVIFLLLGHGHISFPGTFRGTGALWPFAVVVSTVSFVAYVALLQKQLRGIN